MRIKVVGISHNVGTYQGKPYDSIRLYGEYDGDNMVAGTATFAASGNTPAILKWCGEDFHSPADLSALVGETVMLSTNQYNKITDLAILN